MRTSAWSFRCLKTILESVKIEFRLLYCEKPEYSAHSIEREIVGLYVSTKEEVNEASSEWYLLEKSMCSRHEIREYLRRAGSGIG